LVAQEALAARDEHVGPGGLAARKRRRRALHLGPDAMSGQDRHREEHAAETTPVGSAHGMYLFFFASAHRLDLDLPLSWEAVVSTGACPLATRLNTSPVKLSPPIVGVRITCTLSERRSANVLGISSGLADTSSASRFKPSNCASDVERIEY